MIFAQINKYPEQSHTTYYSSSYHDNTKPSADEWAKICNQALEEVSKILQPGDTVETTSQTTRKTTRLTISHFLTDPFKIYPYKEEPCFIMAIDPKLVHLSPSRYALHELNLNSIIKKDTTNV